MLTRERCMLVDQDYGVWFEVSNFLLKAGLPLLLTVLALK